MVIADLWLHVCIETKLARASNANNFTCVLSLNASQVWVAFVLGAAVLRISKECAQQQQACSISADILSTLRSVWGFRGVLVRRLWALTFVPAAFVVFLCVNEVRDERVESLAM